uniref:Katanin p80 WD40 repeat-containing subunit B1 n=1 Tax=Anopheles atroparvus TaxID=41427 RepID=A0AAG5DLX7_ANOAO
MRVCENVTDISDDIQAHSSKVSCLDIGETGRVLVTGGQDRNVKLWAFGNDKCFMTLPGHNSSIDCVKFAYSDDFVYSADDTGVIKRWDLNATESTSLFGHMKSVRTLDFHPYSDRYAVSGSNDTSIRLWDVRQKECIKRYRGHMSHVNSVKFSPDGLWIASAGNEGSVIIWDIRMSKLFMEFTERQTPATCVQYHPSDLLMAAGRHDGTVDLYDLEKRQLLSRGAPPAPKANAAATPGQPVRCVTFDESGKCLFVGTAAGITVIGWEPDREYDRIESNWSQLGDMKVAGSKLLFGTFEEGSVSIHAVPLGHLRAFYNPQNQPPSFNHHQTSRKSFSRGSGKVRLSIGGGGGGVGAGGGGGGGGRGGGSASSGLHSTNAAMGGSFDFGPEGGTGGSGSGSNGGGMSPNLNIEMIDEEDASFGTTFVFDLPPTNGNQPTTMATAAVTMAAERMEANGSVQFLPGSAEPMAPAASSPPSPPALVNSHYLVQDEMQMYNLGSTSDFFPLPKDNLPVAGKEDFPVNSAQPPDYAPKGVMGPPGPQSFSGSGPFANGASSAGGGTGTKAAASGSRGAKHDGARADQRRPGSIHGGVGHSRSAGNLVRRLATSKSTLELNKLSSGEAVTFKKPISRGSSPIRHHHSNQPPYHSGSSSSKIQRSESSAQINSLRNGGERPRQHNANVKVEIVTKPVRSKTSLDMRHHGASRTAAGMASNASIYGHRTPSISLAASGGDAVRLDQLRDAASAEYDVGMGGGTLIGSTLIRYGAHDTASLEYEIQVLRNEHDATLQALCNRNVLLSAIRNYTKTGDVTGALKVAVRMNDEHILVDVLGAILEKTSQWTLDMCVLLLPKVYDLLQSEYKFHCTRACDTLRVILSTFLPVIRENTDPWGACTIGVDVSREERQSKCLECKNWLLRIRCLPENPKMGTNLQQLQNMIVDI